MNGNASYYFLLDTQPATKWHHFAPELQNSVTIQQDIIKELKSKKPQYMIFDSSWDDKKSPIKAQKAVRLSCSTTSFAQAISLGKFLEKTPT